MRRIAAIVAIACLAFSGPVSAAPGPGSLIKLSCPNGAASDHPCKAVYFYGSDGKRHAFPNDKVYFTWYADFASVQTVTSTFMASLALGQNVTYRPAVKMVKFQTLDKTYAVGLGGELRWVTTEDVARGLYGTDWNRQIDDIADAFFTDYRFGADIASAAAYDKSAELAAAATIDDGLESTHRDLRVATGLGEFDIDLVTLLNARYTMITDVAAASDCGNDCAVKSLSEYAQDNGATIGIHGTYFCPPDYADCAGKTNTFLSPVYDTASGVMINAGSLNVHQGPMMAEATDGRRFYFHRTKEFGGSVGSFENVNDAKLQAAMANYPSLIEDGGVIVESESRLDGNQKTVKATRGGIGWNGHSTFLVIAHSATVVDLAYILKALGATEAMNLDGGGSSALLYNGAYKVGPGRLLPNAILFKKR
jgi:hypothetical protein